MTIFEESNIVAVDRFNDLGLEHEDGSDDEKQLDHLSIQQLEQLAVASAHTGKEATARALQIAIEAREIGVSTAGAMHDQTVRLERMGDDFEVVHDYLDKSERKDTTPFLKLLPLILFQILAMLCMFILTSTN